MVIGFKQFVEEITTVTEPVMKTREFKIPVENMYRLEEKIQWLNKKAAKLGTKPNRIVYGEKVTERTNPKEEIAEYRTYQMCTVVGEIPVMAGGWSFVGKLEPHELGAIVKSIPGHVLPQHYQHADATHCEHCGKSRQRSETFIVNKDTEYKQVGRSCLKDFLGHKSPEQYAAYAEYMNTLESEINEYENERGGNYVPEHSTSEIICAALAAVKRDGYYGSSYEGDKERTKLTIFKHFSPPTGLDAKYHTPLNVTDIDRQQAEEVKQFVKDKATTNQDDFWQNLDKFVSVPTNIGKSFGYLAAAAMMYLKEKNMLAAKASMKDGINDAPIGAEGDKVALKLTVISAFQYTRQSYHYGDSGVSQILTMKTEDGKLLKMFTSNLNVNKDDVVTVKGKLGACNVETYESSPFKGLHITQMAPRARLEIQ